MEKKSISESKAQLHAASDIILSILDLCQYFVHFWQHYLLYLHNSLSVQYGDIIM